MLRYELEIHFLMQNSVDSELNKHNLGKFAVC